MSKAEPPCGAGNPGTPSGSHATDHAAARIRLLTEPDDIRAYFSQAAEVLGHLSAVMDKDNQGVARHCVETDVHLHHVGRIATTMRALAMKYGFSGYFTERLPSDLEIASVDSGFPTVTEVRRMEADRTAFTQPDKRLAVQAMPGRRVEPDPSWTDDDGGDLRARMVDHILRHRTPPRELQFLRSQRVYARILGEEKVFGPRVEPALVKLPDSKSGCPRWMAHWGAWDAERQQPIVYLLTVEDTGATLLDRDPARRAALFKACQEMSQSTLQVVTIAVKLDEEFPTLHPKSLDRLAIGPLQSTRFTQVDGDLAAAMSHVRGDWRLDWVLGWTVESVRSRGSRKTRHSILQGERVHEIFDVDPKDFQSVRTGTTEIARRLLMPYDVFQALRLSEGSPLVDVPKFVVDLDGDIASQM